MEFVCEAVGDGYVLKVDSTFAFDLKLLVAESLANELAMYLGRTNLLKLADEDPEGLVDTGTYVEGEPEGDEASVTFGLVTISMATDDARRLADTLAYAGLGSLPLF